MVIVEYMDVEGRYLYSFLTDKVSIILFILRVVFVLNRKLLNNMNDLVL